MIIGRTVHVPENPHHGVSSRFLHAFTTRRGVGGVKSSCRPACVPPPASTSTKIGWFGVRFSDSREPFSSLPSAASSELRSESDCDDEDDDDWWPSSAINRRAARACCLARRRKRSRCMSAALKRIMRAPERTPASAIAVRGQRKSAMRERQRASPGVCQRRTHTVNQLKNPLRVNERK